MTMGERIKQRRLELNLSQDELAQKVGYKSRSSINKIESSRELPLRKINQMATALDCSPAYIMGWVDQETGRESEEANELYSVYWEALKKAYIEASADTQAAVRAILHIEGKDA